MGNEIRKRKICLVPQVSGVGGMVSFRGKLVKGLADRGVEVTFDLGDTVHDAVLVIGGTRDLAGLWKAKRRGVRVVQRLDGMNWIHRRRRTGIRHYLRAEYGNFLLSLIRSRLADGIVYQSEFSHQWWERVYGASDIPWTVVYNGVDLERYTPDGPETRPDDRIRILLVEGSIGGGYEIGLETAIRLAEELKQTHGSAVELVVAGKVSAELVQKYQTKAGIQVRFEGMLPADKIPGFDRSAHFLFAADLNAACPNSVIEALACGLPVAAFDTGALAEIVKGGSGVLVPYGGDPWQLDNADVPRLAQAVKTIIENQVDFRKSARKRAEEAFGLPAMIDGYVKALIE